MLFRSSVDAARGILMIRGAVPGAEGNWVLVKDAAKKKQPKDMKLPYPAALKSADAAPAAKE